MSLFGSLYTGVAGMNAQTQSTANISTNIANIGTTGYKRGETVFFDLVTDKTRPANFSNGSVATTRIQRIDQQGQMQQTQSGTEIAISGNGFFTVKTGADPALETLYTRNGAFSPDSEGILRNSAGFVLYAWPVDANGVPTTTNSEASLVPADINILDEISRATTQSEQVVILNASEESIDPYTLPTGPQQLPISGEDSDFSRSLTVIDSTGTPRDLNFEYRKIVGPMGHLTSGTLGLNFSDVLVGGLSSPTPAIVAGDTFNLTSGGNALTVDFVNGPADISINQANTMQDVLNVINNFTDGANNDVFSATLTSNGRLLVRAVDPAASIDTSASSANVIGVTGFDIINDPSGDGSPLIFEPDASLTANGVANPNQTDLPVFANTTDPNPFGWWEMRVTIADPADPTNTALPPVELSKGLLNFDGSGVLNALPNAAGETLLNLNNINFDNAVAGEEISVATDISGYQQFAAPSSVLLFEQNGVEAGTLTNVTIDRQGLIIGNFSNGEQQTLYQIPLATFANANGLQEESGTVFSRTQDSGDVTFSVATTGGAGTILTSTLESSNVELSEEFSKLIVSQRAFQANSRLVNTIDEMTEQLRQLKR